MPGTRLILNVNTGLLEKLLPGADTVFEATCTIGFEIPVGGGGSPVRRKDGLRCAGPSPAYDCWGSWTCARSR